jgi:hypothetical protein
MSKSEHFNDLVSATLTERGDHQTLRLTADRMVTTGARWFDCDESWK